MLTAGAIARQERIQDRLQFERQTDSLTASLQRSLNRYTDILRSLGDFYAASEQPISGNDFNRFVERVLVEYPGIQALEWAPIVKDADRSQFEASVQAERQAAFQITETESSGQLVRAAQRDYYVPVVYLQPWAGNQPAFGYDLASNNIRKIALETARDRGDLATSGRIRLVQENKNKFGFLVFLPLYQPVVVPYSAVPYSIESRREQVRGYLIGVFRVSDVVEESLATFGDDIDFTLTDAAAAPEDQFLGAYQGSTRTLTTTPDQQSTDSTNQLRGLEEMAALALCPMPENCKDSLTVGERAWVIAFTPADNYPFPFPWIALSTMITGLLATVMMARYLAQSQAALASAQELSRLKIRLFSMASHELRTPLSTILLSAQSLEAAEESADRDTATGDSHQETLRQRARTYRRIRASAKRMNQLLSDLLTLARAESGKIDFLPKTINLVALCEQTIEEVRFSFENTPYIHFVTDAAVSSSAYVDPQLLRTILTNLLSNAVKYSGKDPQVSLILIYRAHAIVLQVKDQGIGISEADQQNLGEAFYRGSNVGMTAGTGLGISVVQACLQMHKGTFTCTSQLGEGTVFEVILPRID